MKPLKARRKQVCMEELFPKREQELFFHIEYSILRAFPNLTQRKEYIAALINGLDTEREIVLN